MLKKELLTIKVFQSSAIMIHQYKTIDCPDANNRIPKDGDYKWTLSFPLENGDDYLEVEIGKRGRDAILAMLSEDERDTSTKAIQ
jgi:hypothetical protein